MNNTVIKSEFIKLARAFLDAHKEAQHSQRAQRRAKSLEQLFALELEKIEKELARVEQLNKPAELPLFGSSQRPEPVEDPARIHTG